MLSVGGWTNASQFPPVASTVSGRLNFAASAVALVKNLGLDGLDLDWEVKYAWFIVKISTDSDSIQPTPLKQMITCHYYWLSER
jgi:hypothetical protein